MSRQANYTRIGAFVVGAGVLVVIAILVFGGRLFFKDDLTCVLYFDESVKGLVIGAPVRFRGVQVGIVKSTSLLYEGGKEALIIPVIIEIYKGSILPREKSASGLPATREERVTMLKDFIAKGLRAQLVMESLVTGQLSIQLDFMPQFPARLVAPPHDHMTEIPTVPSGLQQLRGRLEAIPIDEIARQAQSTLTGIDKLVNSPEAAESLRSFRDLLQNSEDLVHKMNAEIEPLRANLQAKINELTNESRDTLQQADKTLAAIESVFGTNSPLLYRLDTTLKEIHAAANSLQLFADYLERHPDALLLGKSDSGDKQ